MDDYLVYRGELTDNHSLWRRGFFFVLPAMSWILAFLVLPGFMLFFVSFMQRGDFGNIDWTFTIENMKRLAGYDLFGWSADNLMILGRSLWVAFIATLLCVLLSYPLAFFLATRPPETRNTWMTALLIPFWTNLVIRTYAWLLVLAPEMPIAKFLSSVGWLEPGTPAYPSSIAVWLGMVSTFLPFVALPLYTAVEKLDWTLVEASKDLYAGRMRTFWKAIFPQTLPGISVGITLTLVPAMGMFVVPDMLGGARYMLVGNLIQQQFGTARDWPFGATLSIALMGLTLVFLLLAGRIGRRSNMEGRA